MVVGAGGEAGVGTGGIAHHKSVCYRGARLLLPLWDGLFGGGRVSPRSKDKLFFKLFLLFSFSKDDGEIRRCAKNGRKYKIEFDNYALNMI